MKTIQMWKPFINGLTTVVITELRSLISYIISVQISMHFRRENADAMIQWWIVTDACMHSMLYSSVSLLLQSWYVNFFPWKQQDGRNRCLCRCLHHKRWKWGRTTSYLSGVMEISFNTKNGRAPFRIKPSPIKFNDYLQL